MVILIILLVIEVITFGHLEDLVCRWRCLFLLSIYSGGVNIEIEVVLYLAILIIFLIYIRSVVMKRLIQQVIIRKVYLILSALEK